MARLSPGRSWVEWRQPSWGLTAGKYSIATTNNTAETSAERSLQLALAAARTAHENQGRHVVVLDMRDQTPIFDYFVIATGNSRRQLHAISEDIDHKLEDDLGDQRMGIEGYSESRWILLDYGTVVIHLFDEETRDFYALEDLWAGAGRVPLPWEKDAQAAQNGQNGQNGQDGHEERLRDHP